MSTVAVDEATTVTVDELTELVKRATALPANLRISLARKVLESLEANTSPHAAPARTTSPDRGLSADEIRDQLKSDAPPPDDETVKRWIGEYRMENMDDTNSI